MAFCPMQADTHPAIVAWVDRWPWPSTPAGVFRGGTITLGDPDPASARVYRMSSQEVRKRVWRVILATSSRLGVLVRKVTEMVQAALRSLR